MIDKTQHNEKKLAQKKTVKDNYLKLLSMYKWKKPQTIPFK